MSADSHHLREHGQRLACPMPRDVLPTCAVCGQTSIDPIAGTCPSCQAEARRTAGGTQLGLFEPARGQYAGQIDFAAAHDL